MLHVTRNLIIPDADLAVSASRSGGPGGQNVNKVETKIELRLRLAACEALSAGVKQRLREAFPGYITRDGVLIVTSSRHRTQARNRLDAEERLASMIRSVLTPPKSRRPTRPSQAARRRRLESKSRTARLKRQRRRPGAEE